MSSKLISSRMISIFLLALTCLVGTNQFAIAQVTGKSRAKSAPWSSIDTQTDAEFSGGDVYSLASARLLDTNGDFWISWDTSLTPVSHDLSLINSRRERIDQVRLTDIALVGDSGLFICGEQGILLESRDWGKKWSQRYFPNLDLLYFYGVEFTKAGVGILIGSTGEGSSRYQGIIYRSDDFGKTWNKMDGISGMGFSRLNFDRASNTFVITAMGSLLTSDEKGLTWESITLPISELMRDTRMYGELGVSVGQKGNILRSLDRGANWTEVKSPTTTNLTSIHIHSQATWYVAGSGGEVWETNDRGETWKSLNIPKNVTLNGVKRVGPRLVVWGSGGTFMKLAVK